MAEEKVGEKCIASCKSNETLDHMFLHCPFTGSGWFFLMNIFGFSDCLLKSIEDWLVEVFSTCNWSKQANILWNCWAQPLLWLIWLERNQRVFEDKSSSIEFFCKKCAANFLLVELYP